MNHYYLHNKPLCYSDARLLAFSMGMRLPTRKELLELYNAGILEAHEIFEVWSDRYIGDIARALLCINAPEFVSEWDQPISRLSTILVDI